jgi:hypothetical protein
VEYGGGAYTGALALPAESDVKKDVQYGADGTEFAGELEASGGAYCFAWIG